MSLAWRGSQEATHQGPESRGNLTLAIRESGLTKPALWRRRGRVAARLHFEADAGSHGASISHVAARTYASKYVDRSADPFWVNLSE